MESSQITKISRKVPLFLADIIEKGNPVALSSFNLLHIYICIYIIYPSLIKLDVDQGNRLSTHSSIQVILNAMPVFFSLLFSFFFLCFLLFGRKHVNVKLGREFIYKYVSMVRHIESSLQFRYL